jgi:ATP-dependent helicase/nuclease subunit A
MNSQQDPPLADAAERALAAADLTQTYLVEAAAGTGKTTLLVQRVLNIVRQKQTPLSRVVAITFTEKAAGDLKIKLRSALESVLRTDAEHHSLFAAALHDLDAMSVGTIHAFCRDLIAQRPVEAGTDPGFVVADEAAARLLRDEVWEAWMAGELNQKSCPAYPFLERGLAVASVRRELSLRSLFDAMVEQRDDLKRFHITAADPSLLELHIASFVRATEAAFDLAQNCRREEDTLLRTLRIIERWSKQVDWTDFAAALRALRELPSFNKGHKGQQGNWTADALTQARAFVETFREQCATLAAKLISREAAPVIEWLKGAADAYEQAKRERGWLDFNDLLWVAQQLLQQHIAVREDFKARYDYLLVDEFQDTDPLQTEIVFFLAEQPSEFAARWTDVKTVPGKLFIVADPKQSIYRFRRADLDLYGAVRKKIESAGRCLPIRVNFRCDPAIIREVNEVFRDLMTGISGDHYEPDYVAMEPHRPSGGDSRIILLPPSTADDVTAATVLAQREAACIAEYVCRVVEKEELLRDGDPTPIRYRDIGILYFATTHLADLEQALRARDIPYQIAGGRDFGKRIEVQALQAVLAAIDNPFDQMAVVGALRSPFFACSDEELLQHHLTGGDFVYTTATSHDSYLEANFALLRELHEQRRHGSVAMVVASLLEKTPGLMVYGLKPQGEARIGNLLKVLDWAQRYENDGGSFHDLTRWLARLEDLRTAEDDSLPAESGDDAVQLMTFHKAKGLEFPMVILYRLAHEFSPARNTLLLDRRTGALEFSSPAGTTSNFNELLNDEEQRARQETMRLLYVAMTRARDKLVLPLYWEKPERAAGKRWLHQFLRAQYASDESGLPLASGDAATVEDTSSYNLESPPRENLIVKIAVGERSDAPPVRTDQPEQWRVQRDTAAESLNRDQTLLRPSDLVEIPETTARSGGTLLMEPAAAFGRFVHRMLERVALPQAGNLQSLAAATAEEFAVSEEQCEEGQRLVRELLNSDFFTQRVLPAGRWWRELNFVADDEGTLVEGVMDLVYYENKLPVIVDYKTDFVSAAEIHDHAQRYRGQAAAYARALSRIVGQPAREVVLCFLRLGMTVTLSGDDLSIA